MLVLNNESNVSLFRRQRIDYLIQVLVIFGVVFQAKIITF